MRRILGLGGRPQLKLAIVVTVAGVAAGCSNGSSRLPGGALFAASNPPASTTVTTSALPPLSAPATPSPLGANKSLADRGWSVEGAPVVEVGPGDTAASLSQGYGVPVSVIVEANRLTSAADVRPGQRLVVPTYVYRDNLGLKPSTVAAAAPGPGAPPTTLSAQASEGRHVVQPSDTLWSIATAHRVSPEAVRRLNGLDEAGTVKVGSTLRIPPTDAAGQTTTPTEVALAAPAPTPEPDANLVKVSTAPAATASVPDAPQQEPAVAAATPSAEGFRWPVRGRILTGFGKQADGARNDGINLAVPAGTPVRAAGAGTVIYAGNELEGYGNLILVQHGDDWVSAYAHNETLKVSRGDKVERGQAIAAAGKSGSVDEPQLHFELRKKSKPVDPLPHLSGA